ncbi:hypothetical protein ACFL3J_00615 [Candidatus Omnitrophota bacterium]
MSAINPTQFIKKIDKNTIAVFLLYFLVIAYLVINTGIISDDFDAMDRLSGKSFVETLIPTGKFYFIETPAQYYVNHIWYHFFRIDNQTAANAFKIFYIFLSFYLISRFFSIFLNRQNALFVSFLFIFFPSHDSTTYWFMIQSMTLCFAFYLYAFYLAYRDKIIPAFLLATLASFISYGSPVLAISLFILFALYKKFKKGLVLLIPNIIYSAYYIFVSKFLAMGVDKTAMAKDSSVYSVVKQFALQVITFIDATVGPSMWVKIYYAFSQLSVLSIIIGILLTVVFYKKYREGAGRYDRKLLFALLVLTCLSLGMFAVTGFYPQLAFNLGNRVTIFGSLLLAYLFVLMPMPHKLRTAAFALIIFTVLGISDHWKDWSLQQQRVARNIKNNQEFIKYETAEVIFVSGNQYSKYGPISHIEFLSEGYVVAPLVHLLFEGRINATPITKRHVYQNGYLVDKRDDFKIEVRDSIIVYDSEKDEIFVLDAEEINLYIDSLPTENRHWIQVLDNKTLKGIIFRLMPRLRYGL